MEARLGKKTTLGYSTLKKRVKEKFNGTVWSKLPKGISTAGDATLQRARQLAKAYDFDLHAAVRAMLVWLAIAHKATAPPANVAVAQPAQASASLAPLPTPAAPAPTTAPNGTRSSKRRREASASPAVSRVVRLKLPAKHSRPAAPAAPPPPAQSFLLPFDAPVAPELSSLSPSYFGPLDMALLDIDTVDDLEALLAEDTLPPAWPALSLSPWPSTAAALDAATEGPAAAGAAAVEGPTQSWDDVFGGVPFLEGLTMEALEAAAPGELGVGVGAAEALAALPLPAAHLGDLDQGLRWRC